MLPWRRRGYLILQVLLVPLLLLAVGLVPVMSPSTAGGFHTAVAGYLASETRAALAVLSRPEPVLPPGLSIANLPVGGLTLEEARAALQRYRLDPLYRPLPLRVAGQALALHPQKVGLQVDLGPALAQAEAYAAAWPFRRWDIYLAPGGFGVQETLLEDLPVPVGLDRAALRSLLESLALSVDEDPLPLQPVVLQVPSSISVMGVVSSTWSSGAPVILFRRARGGRRLDVDASLSLVESALKQWVRGPVVLPVEEIPPPPADLTLLGEALRGQVDAMPGVVGVYVRDLETGREVGVNEGVVFSGASVIKIAILLQAYRALGVPAAGTVARDMWGMMVHSDNEAANRLLAVGGAGNAVRGTERMSQMLLELGLEHSYMCNPYSGGAPWRGCRERRLSNEDSAAPGDPWTDPDDLLQTTPRDMGRLLAYLYGCSLGEGPLLEHFPGEITAEECQAMLTLMGQNADQGRMVAGLPAGVVAAHKSGWIRDMKADAGIVFSSGGTYVLSIFVWENGGLSDQDGNPRIANLSWTVYAFFNPM